MTVTVPHPSTSIEEAYQARTPKSRALYERALQCMPGGDTRTGTFFLPYPLTIERGFGCHVEDADGNDYVDFHNNYSSLVLGHAHPKVVEAITTQAALGTVHGASSALQSAVAETVVERIPSVECVRFANSGTEAVMTAVRAARAFTGKTTILKMEGGYHGSWETVEVSVFPRAGAEPPPWPRGVPDGAGLSPAATDEVLVAPFNDLDKTAEIVHTHREELAAIIVEPMMNAAGMIPGEREYLQGLETLARDHRIPFILDEVVTFRLDWGGMQKSYDLQPDITVLGKMIGGGLPVGAVGGREAIMAQFDPRKPESLFHSGTFNANPMTMIAGLATLDLLSAEAIQRLNALGDRLGHGLQAALDRAGVVGHVTGLGSLRHVHLTGPPIRSFRDAARADAAAYRQIHLALLSRGVFAAPRGFFCVSTPMTEDDVDRGVAAFGDALDAVSGERGAGSRPLHPGG